MIYARRLLLVAAAVLLVGATAALLLRRDLAQRVVRARLARQGIVLDAITVAEVGPGRAVFHDVRLGELSIARLTVAYRPGGLWRGRVAGSEVHGLRLHLAGGAQGEAATLESRLAGLPALVRAIGPTRLDDARVELDSPLGPLVVSGSGTLRPGAGGEAVADLAGQASIPAGTLSARLEGRIADSAFTGALTVDGGHLEIGGLAIAPLRGRVELAPAQPAQVELSAPVHGGDGALVGTLSLHARIAAAASTLAVSLAGADAASLATLEGELAGPDGSPRLDLRLAARAGAGAPLWCALGLPEPEAGTAEVTLELAGTLPPRAALQAQPLAALAGDLGGRLELALAGLRYKGGRTARGTAGLTAARAGNRLVFRLARPARLELVPPGAFTLSAAAGPPLELGLDGAGWALSGAGTLGFAGSKGADLAASARADLAGAWGEGIARLALTDLTVSGRDLELAGIAVSSLRARGRGEGVPPALSARLDVDVVLPAAVHGALRHGEAAATLPLVLAWRDPALRVELAAPGSLRLAAAELPGSARLDAPLALTLARGRIDLGRAGGALSLRRAALDLVAAEAAFALATGSGAPTRLSGSFEGQVSSPAPGRIAIDIASPALTLPAAALAAEEVRLRLVPGAAASEPLARVTVGALRHLAAAPAFTAVGVEAALRADGRGELVIEGRATLAGGAAVFRLGGHHDRTAGRGELIAESEGLRFEPGRLQPRALLPWLAPLAGVRGGAEVAVTLAWGPGAPAPAARLRANGVAFGLGLVQVDGAALELDLTSLSPPAGEAAQLRMAHVSLGLGLTLDDLSARFALRPGSPPQLHVDEAGAAFAGGRLAVAAIDLDLAPGRAQEAALRFQGLDLGKLLGAFAIDGLDGEGRLSGSVPVRHQGGTTLLPGGRLVGDGPGVVRYRSARAGELLAQGGAPVELLLRALHDFRYSELTATVDKGEGDDVRVVASLLGHNPEVLEGYPFRINIDLETNLTSLLAALRQGQSLGENIRLRLR